MSHDRAQLNGRGNLFTQFFPSPAFLTMPAIGIDISDSTIKFSQLARSKVGKVPVVLGEEQLASGAVVGGEIRDLEKLVLGLKAVSKRVEPHFVRASLPEQKAYLFSTQVPSNASYGQILNVIEFQLEEHVPLSPSESVFDYEPVSGSSEVHDHLDIGVAVYPKNTVEKYTKAFLRAGFFPLSFEIEAQAILRSVIPKGDMGTYLVVDFGETGAGIAIASKGALIFTSTLDIKGADLTEIIIKELDVERERVSEIKNTIGVAKGSDHAPLVQKLTGAIEKLAEELKRHYIYWETRQEEGGEKEDAIERVILCGGNANLKGLPEYLEHKLRTPVLRANVWQNAFSFEDMVPGIPYENSLSYGTAIGLALRDDN